MKSFVVRCVGIFQHGIKSFPYNSSVPSCAMNLLLCSCEGLTWVHNKRNLIPIENKKSIKIFSTEEFSQLKILLLSSKFYRSSNLTATKYKQKSTKAIDQIGTVRMIFLRTLCFHQTDTFLFTTKHIAKQRVLEIKLSSEQPLQSWFSIDFVTLKFSFNFNINMRNFLSKRLTSFQDFSH